MDRWTLTCTVGDVEQPFGEFAGMGEAMDAVDQDRVLPWIQGGPSYVAARVEQSWFAVRRTED